VADHNIAVSGCENESPDEIGTEAKSVNDACRSVLVFLIPTINAIITKCRPCLRIAVLAWTTCLPL
jgi:hypothetical protein